MANEVEVIKNYFKSKYLHVSDYYIQCCVEWIRSQYERCSERELCEKVYEQWLLVDLREIGEGILPAELSKQKNRILQGNFAVQLMYLKDISRSSLSQLKNIRNMYKMTKSSVEKGPDYEPPGKRVLYLHLTDGIEFIYAFEYEPVSCLDINMAPGVKLLLSGPLMIRNGEILLKNCNVKVLGGEVEDLLVCNNVENVLARELNLPENPTPGVIETQSESNETQNQTSCTLPVDNRQQNMVQNRQQVYNDNTNQNRQESSTRNQQQTITNNTNQRTITSMLSNPSTSNQLVDEFDDFGDDDAFLRAASPILNAAQNKQQSSFPEDDDFDMHFDAEMMDFEINDHFDDFQKEEPKQIQFPIPVSHDPYNYIKQLIDSKDTLVGKTVQVKAQFISVVEKLTFSSTKGWTMKFKISDGTGVVVVDFLSRVLEELVGVNHEQALVLKQRIKNKDVTAAERIKEVLYECKEKLTLLNCFMGLKYVDQTEIPTVIWLKPVLLKDLKNLKQRVDIIKNT